MSDEKSLLFDQEKFQWQKELLSQSELHKSTFIPPKTQFQTNAFLEFVPLIAGHPTFDSVFIEATEFHWDNILSFVRELRAQECLKKGLKSFRILLFASKWDNPLHKGLLEKLQPEADNLCIGELPLFGSSREMFDEFASSFKEISVERLKVLLLGEPTEEDIEEMKSWIQYPFQRIKTLFLEIMTDDYLNWVALVKCFEELKEIPTIDVLSIRSRHWSLESLLRIMNVLNKFLGKPTEIQLQFVHCIDSSIASELELVKDTTVCSFKKMFHICFDRLHIGIQGNVSFSVPFCFQVLQVVDFIDLSWDFSCLVDGFRVLELTSGLFCDRVRSLDIKNHDNVRSESICKPLLVRALPCLTKLTISAHLEDVVELGKILWHVKSLKCMEIVLLTVTSSAHSSKLIDWAKSISETSTLTHLFFQFFNYYQKLDQEFFRILIGDCSSLESLLIRGIPESPGLPDFFLDLLASNSNLHTFSTDLKFQISKETQHKSLMNLLSKNNVLIKLDASILLDDNRTFLTKVLELIDLDLSFASKFLELLVALRTNQSLCFLKLSCLSTKSLPEFHLLYNVLARNICSYRTRRLLFLILALKKSRMDVFDLNCVKLIVSMLDQARYAEDLFPIRLMFPQKFSKRI